ncbi:hypothetical protein [Lentibacillus sp. Marseille-P4043]|nr:hypothetical protein [Lentibacillus sp. Marseille-P4043]
MEINGIGIIIIIIIAYLPIVYNLQKRIRKLENQVNELQKRR